MSPLTKLEPFKGTLLLRASRKIFGMVKKTIGIGIVLFFSSMWIVTVFVALHLMYSWIYGINTYLKWFDVWIIIEAAFLLFQSIKYRIFRNVNSDHLPKMSEDEFESSIKEMIHNNDSPAEFLSGWFFNEPIERISRRDVMDWVAGTFWNTVVDQANARETALINRWIDAFEKKVGFKFKNQQNTTPCRKIVLTRDPITIYHKPLVHYCAVRIANFSAWLILSAMGFQKYKGLACPFFYRKVDDPQQMPLVFFHGLGIGIVKSLIAIGLITYVPFILSLIINQPHRPIVLFEMPSISMIWEDNHLLPKEYATHVRECLIGLKISKCIVAGHSIGTALVRWMDLFYPEMIHGRIFIDPICFNLWTHHTAFNALYRSPRTLNEAFIKFVGMSEAGIATFLHRYFVWFQNTYFTHQLPKNCMIFLAGRDDIINAPNISNYLSKNEDESRQIMYLSNFHHGQIMASTQAFEIIKEINKMG